MNINPFEEAFFVDKLVIESLTFINTNDIRSDIYWGREVDGCDERDEAGLMADIEIKAGGLGRRGRGRREVERFSFRSTRECGFRPRDGAELADDKVFEEVGGELCFGVTGMVVPEDGFLLFGGKEREFILGLGGVKIRQ